MTDCTEEKWLFQELGKRKVEVDFGGGYLSSDGGGLILRELERHSGLVRDLVDQMPLGLGTNPKEPVTD